nr:topless-related protein 3 isoform X2 [Ipomoea batatas]
MWEFTKVVNQVQCQMVSMPECSDTKVARLLYTNSGVGILALSSNGIQKLWKWPNNEQNPTGKATANSAPQHWQPNSGLVMINDVVDVNLEKVVPCIDLYKNDSYIVSAFGGKVSFFNIMTFEVMTTFRLYYHTPTFLVVYPCNNNVIAIGTENGRIIIYNVRVDEVKVEFDGDCNKRITGLAFSTTDPSILVSSSADAKICVWDIGCGWHDKRSVRIRSPAGKVHPGDTHVMFHTDQLHLLVTHETQLAIYDTSNNMKRKHQWIPQGCLPAPISSATYSCNSQLVYASFIDGNIGVLDADNLTLRCRIAPSAYLSQSVLNSSRSEDVYPLVIAAHPQKPNQFAIGLTDGSIKVIEPLESQGNWEVSISSPVDNGKRNGRLIWQVLRGTLATMCLGLFGVGIIRIIQTKTRKSKMKFDGYIRDRSKTNRSDRVEQGKPNQPRD